MVQGSSLLNCAPVRGLIGSNPILSAMTISYRATLTLMRMGRPMWYCPDANMKKPMSKIFFYAITVASLLTTVVLSLTFAAWNFSWLLHGGPTWGTMYDFWHIAGKIILFFPLGTLLLSFGIKKRWYFITFSIINILVTLIQVVLLLLPAT